MPVTYENLATTTLTGNQTSITFSSISQNYTDLVLVCFAFTSGTVTTTGPTMRVGNGTVDSGTNYSYTPMTGNGSSAFGGRETNQTVMKNIVQDATTTNPSTGIVNFLNYANTTTNKTVLSRMSNGEKFVSATVNLWRSTSAINIITIYSPDNGSASTPFTSGSTFTLYGIKAA